MKKMILLVSMLAGVMTFSGCVDDKESASVTAVREAKAAQLSALAALSNAQAANQQALADTENALREAKVAYETAKAAYQQALADKANSEAQAAAARAQQQMADAQNEIQRLANDLEKMAIQHKIDMLDLQTQYEAALKKADDDSQALLGGLYMAYQTAATNLLNAQQDIAQQKIDLAKLQAGLVDSEEAKQLMINKENRKIASAEQTIAEWKAKLEVFEAQKAPEEAKAELVTEKAALSQLAQDKAKASEAAGKASEEMNDARSDIYDQKYHGLAMDVTGGTYGNFIDEEGNPTGAFGDFIYLQGYEETALGKPVEATVDTYWFSTTDDKGNTTYTAVMNRMIQKTVTKTETTAPGVESTNTYEAYPTYYYQLNAEGVKAYVAAIKANVTKNEGKALEAANKALAAQQKVVADLEKAEIKDEAAIEEAKSMLPDLQANVNTAKAALDKANAQVAAIQAAFDTMAAEAANWTATVEAYNAASEAYCDAQFVCEKAEDAYGLQNAKVRALEAVVRGNVIVDDGLTMTFDDAIEYAERQIANAINMISHAKQDIANIEIAEDDQLTALAIERLEAEIAIAEAEIPALEKIVADTKAALDAATAAQAE